MSRSHVIVVGLGAVGSAAAWRLAAEGHRVTGFDRWSPPHGHGSTHGETRVTRLTAWEGPQYVPLVRRANALIAELEEATGHALVRRTGGLFIGAPADYFVTGSRACAAAAGLPHEVVSREEIARRHPFLQAPEGMVGFVDPSAGVLYPELIVQSALDAARNAGATLRLDEPILEWAADGDGVRVRSARDSLRADRLILCTGAWMPEVLAPLGVTCAVERLTMHWFDASPAALDAADGMPVLLLGDGAGHVTAVFPTRDGLIKAAGHGSGEFGPPEAIDRSIRASDIAPVEAIVRRFLPQHVGTHRRSATCLYTNTPNKQFILDRHPEHRQIVLGSPCNGFGFKFAPASGEALAALATDSPPPVPIGAWSLPR
ncbi:MAG: N-methyl-L-tryptophan oxidase [Gemmatimonadaceae bacterium]